MGLIITYEKLKKTLTEAEAFEYIKQLAQTFKFPATSFLSGSIGYTILKIQGAILAIISDSISEISKQIYLDESSGNYLSLLADNFFDVQRLPETQTIIQPKITTTSAIPTTYDPESVKIKIAGVEFYNEKQFSIEANGSILTNFASTDFGADTRVATDIAPIFSDNIIGNAVFDTISNEDGYFKVIANGQDLETDDNLKERCRTKWATLSTLGPEDAYKNWILNTINENKQLPVNINKVKVQRSLAQALGFVNIYCANNDGVVTLEDIFFANKTIQKNRSINASVYVSSAAAEYILYSLKVTVNSKADPNDELIKEAIYNIIYNYYASIDIGGVILKAGERGYVVYSKIVDGIMELPGIENVEFLGFSTSHSGQIGPDLQISEFEIPITSIDQTNHIAISRI